MILDGAYDGRFERFHCFYRPGVSKQDYLEAQRESDLLFSEVRAILSRGATVDRVIKNHDRFDLGFISAHRQGETDSLGNVHHEGEKISHKENQRNLETLGQELQSYGIGFVQQKGMYDKLEDSYVCMNTLDSLKTFEQILGKCASDYGQDSIVVYPRVGSGELPYYYTYATKSRTYMNSDSIKEVDAEVDNYFSQIKGRKYQVGSSLFYPVDVRGRNSLSVVSSGMRTMIPVSRRLHNIDTYAADLERLNRGSRN